MSKFGDDLRAIVGVDKIKEDLKELNDRVQILSQRSVAYQQQNGQVSGVTGKAGANGISAGGSATTGSSVGDAAGGAMAGQGFTSGEGGGGSGGGSNTPGQGFTTQDSEEGKLDLKEILDNNADGAPVDNTGQGGLVPVTNAINGWTGSSGTNGVFRFGENNFVPPSNWDDPNTPPEDPGYDENLYWITSNPATFYGSTPADAMRGAVAAIASQYPDIYGAAYTDSNTTIVVPGSLAIVDWYAEPEGPVNSVAVYSHPIGSGPAPGFMTIPGDARPYFWPKSGEFQITSNSLLGAFVTHPRDSEAEYNPIITSNVVMSFDVGRSAVMATGANGTKILYELDTATLTPKADTQAHIYSANGVLLSLVPSSQLQAYGITHI